MAERGVVAEVHDAAFAVANLGDLPIGAVKQSGDVSGGISHGDAAGIVVSVGHQLRPLIAGG